MPSRDPSLPLQKAFVSALKGFTAAGANVFDKVPSSDPFPRITIGDDQTLLDAADCYDGHESFAEINVWSRAVGFPEVKTIANQVTEILNDQILPLDGHIMGLMSVDQVIFNRDPDGLTSRARMIVRVLSQSAD